MTEYQEQQLEVLSRIAAAIEENNRYLGEISGSLEGIERHIDDCIEVKRSQYSGKAAAWLRILSHEV